MLLLANGFARVQEFEELEIRSCRFGDPGDNGGTVRAMVPRSDLILLSNDYESWGQTTVTTLLAHELVHVRQRRALGSAAYDCLYGSYLRKGLGFGRHNPFEQEAYEFGKRVANRLRRQVPIQ